MDAFAYYLIAGICLGAVYALVALGYTLVYGIMKLINFAHGEFYMVGAYAGFFTYAMLPAGMSLWLAIPVILVISGVAGAAIAAIAERVAYRPIRNSGRLAALLTAIGVSVLLQQLAAFIRNGNPQMYAGRLAEACLQPVAIGSGGIERIKFAFLGISVVLTILLWLLVQRTRFGRAMRATSQDTQAALLMGVNINSVIRQTFVVGGFLAGVAGTLTALATTVVEPMMGFLPGLNAFVAAVVGGIGSIPGAVLGGYLIGIVQYLVVWAGVPTAYKDVASFTILVLVLVVRPEGLLGRKYTEKV